MAPVQHESKTKLLEATLKVVRVKGYSATRIEDICTEAGLTQGKLLPSLQKQGGLGAFRGGALVRLHSRVFRRGALPRSGRPAGPSAGVCRLPQGNPGRRPFRLHLLRRNV